ncbi:heme oxygenase [Paenibacillus endophyticus]|uniref:Heme oxygenase n=1 Tax=Paenibacillus endophyticus TaxID=1294268 RepID=A0A7W5CDB5_9BACL|nr:biliverdin-producing heme oxygenase [Paenibacillus endophyticus]MBB3155527.1 heme oxygenase [Paenibacillus endophyticus]
MSIMTRLREETASNHVQIESNPYAKAIMNQTLTQDEYVRYLEKFYGFIKPAERLIAQLSGWGEFGEAMGQRAKSPLLERDLHTLGLSLQEIENLPECSKLPELYTVPQALGYMYVIEGSTLGGQIITKQVRKFLPLAEQENKGTEYFNAYGTETRAKWAEFREQVEQSIDSEEAAQQVIEAAKSTFGTLEVWLNE